MKFAQLLLAVCLAAGILGCGQKGPLVMPDAQKHKRVIPAPPRAPAPTSAPASAPPGTPAPTTPSTPAPDSSPHP